MESIAQNFDEINTKPLFRYHVPGGNKELIAKSPLSIGEKTANAIIYAAIQETGEKLTTALLWDCDTYWLPNDMIIKKPNELAVRSGKDKYIDYMSPIIIPCIRHTLPDGKQAELSCLGIGSGYRKSEIVHLGDHATCTQYNLSYIARNLGTMQTNNTIPWKFIKECVKLNNDYLNQTAVQMEWKREYARLHIISSTALVSSFLYFLAGRNELNQEYTTARNDMLEVSCKSVEHFLREKNFKIARLTRALQDENLIDKKDWNAQQKQRNRKRVWIRNISLVKIELFLKMKIETFTNRVIFLNEHPEDIWKHGNRPGL